MRVWPGLFATALLTACASGGAPAPIDYGGAPGSAPTPQRRAAPIDYGARPARQRPAANAPAPDWAEGPGTPLSAYALRPEEVHPFDPANLPRTHRVARNESVYDIAALYQLPIRAVIDQNNLAPPFALSPGQTLRLPPPRLHRVAQGETLESVARRYNVDARSLALLNRMQPPYELAPGDQVVLPALARADAAIAEAPAPSAPPIARGGDGRFAWPVRGEVITRFGAQPGGGRSDGVEIAAEEGAPIAAAADGEVVYAGADLAAYGTLILVRHEGDWVTAYGYARRAAVREGQRVRRGEALGEVGRRGERAMLLFQTRQASRVVDPLTLLSAP